jgi:hypothetical protein
MADSRRGPRWLVWLLLGLGALTRLVRFLTHRRTRLARVNATALTAGYETKDMSVGSVVVLGVGLLMTLVVIVLAMSWLQLRLAGPPAQTEPSQVVTSLPAEALPAEPRLETTPGETIARVRATEQQRLHSFGWVNRETGTVRIPIEQAMDLIVQRGLPVDASIAEDGREVTLPSDSSSGRVEQRVWP